MNPKITIEQWLCFQAVADEGSYAKASEKLHKSVSTISYNIAQLQSRLGVEVFTIEGRKSVLTETGRQLLHRSRRLTAMAEGLESDFKSLSQGYEDELHIMVDNAFPRSCLYKALVDFDQLAIRTRLHIYEGVLSGPNEFIMQDKQRLAISIKAPEGTIGIKLLDITTQPYAHIDNPLHKLNRPLTMDDLYNVRHLIAMDSGTVNKRNEGWLGSDFNWRVDSLYLKSQLMAHGIGFSWLSEHIVNENKLPLKPLPFDKDVSRTYTLYLIHQEELSMGPATEKLIECFCQATKA